MRHLTLVRHNKLSDSCRPPPLKKTLLPFLKKVPTRNVHKN